MTREGRLGADYTPASSPTPTAADDRLSGVVAVVIAFAALVAAFAGFLQADASNAAADRRAEAEHLALRALASSQSAQQEAQVELETLQTWLEQRALAGNAVLAGLYAGSDPARAEALERERQRWEAIAEQTLALSAIDPESEFGPEQDPTFPTRYFAAATQESLRLNALEDAANEEASAIDQRAASYTAILATLAVSLYLFGLTLAVSGRWLRLGFLGTGLALLAFGSLWMVQTLLAGPYETNDEAAAAYAQARVAALTSFDQNGYKAAEALYDRAIELRPTFARAHLDRSGVILSGASPQRSGYVSLAPPEALQRARADLVRARSLGLENAQTFGSLGFYAFAEGVQLNDLTLLSRSADYTRQAIALDPGEPVYRFNLGVALVAAGRIDEARGAYNDGVIRTLFLDDPPTTLRQEPFFEEFVLAGALTDLEIVRRYRSDLDQHIAAVKSDIVGRITAGTLEAPLASNAELSNLSLDLFPGELQWQATIANYDEDRDTISAQWYHEDPQALGWAVIPEVSVTVVPGLGADGRHYQLSSYLTTTRPARCLPVGRYRAEIYVNGRLAAEGTVEAPFPELTALVARDVTTALCRPADWNRVENRLPGLYDGYSSADGRYGVYAARYVLPGTLRQLPDPAAEIADLTISSISDSLPDTPVYDDETGTTTGYFMGLSDTAWRWYDYGSGYVRVGAGLTDDGAVNVGLVFGPREWFDTDDPFTILNSLVYVE